MGISDIISLYDTQNLLSILNIESGFSCRVSNLHRKKYLFSLINNFFLLKCHLIIIIYSDDAFFNRNWAGACWGRWAGIGIVTGLVCWLWTLDSSAKAKTKRIGGGLPVASPMPKSVLP